LTVAVGSWALTVTGNDTAGPALFALVAFLWWQLQEYIRRILYTRGEVFPPWSTPSWRMPSAWR
jgi:hypothetical protein